MSDLSRTTMASPPSVPFETDEHHDDCGNNCPLAIDCEDLGGSRNNSRATSSVEISLSINGGVKKFVATKASFDPSSRQSSKSPLVDRVARFEFDSLRISKDESSTEGGLPATDIVFLLRAALHQIEAMAQKDADAGEPSPSESLAIANRERYPSESVSALPTTTLETTQEGICWEEGQSAEEEQDRRHRMEGKQRRTSYLNMYARKFLGSDANLLPQPLFSWKETAWTFSGVLITLLLLFAFNHLIITTLGHDHAIIMGPFGALLTLQYGVTSAPLGQPRNILYGQAASLLIAFGVGSLVAIPVFVRQSLATASVIAAMVKFGLTHPPAGAAAFIVSDGRTSLGSIYTTLIANVIAIFCATFINNLCDERQYPMKWDLDGCFRTTLAKCRRWCAKNGVTKEGKTSVDDRSAKNSPVRDTDEAESGEIASWEQASENVFPDPKLSVVTAATKEEQTIRMPTRTEVLRANHQSFRRYNFSVMQWRNCDISAEIWRDMDLEADNEIVHAHSHAT